MQLKFCIAKMVGTAPVYQADTANTWVSDITDKSVEWYASEGAARNALQGPETFVVAYEDITMAMRCDALIRACESLAEAIRIGAVEKLPEYSALYVPHDVFKCLGIKEESASHGEICHSQRVSLRNTSVMPDYAGGVRMIGFRIKAAREAAGMSQSDLARAAGIPRQYVSAWESGAYSPSLENLVILSVVLDISLDQLMKEEKK